MITFSSSGSFNATESFLQRVSSDGLFSALDHYGQQGVDALASATPVDSGLTAQSWTYEIVKDANSYSIIWDNTHIENGMPIAILIQYGHATRTGGYVEGRDYINPALRPIFDQIAKDAWREVTK